MIVHFMKFAELEEVDWIYEVFWKSCSAPLLRHTAWIVKEDSHRSFNKAFQNFTIDRYCLQAVPL